MAASTSRSEPSTSHQPDQGVKLATGNRAGSTNHRSAGRDMVQAKIADSINKASAGTSGWRTAAPKAVTAHKTPSNAAQAPATLLAPSLRNKTAPQKALRSPGL